MIRIVVAGDIRLYRDGVVLYLGRDPRLAVVGVAGDRAELVRRVRLERPAIVIIDMAMPESLAAARGLAHELAPPRVIAITAPERERAAIACAEAGIAGYVPREGSLDDLVRAIESVTRGEPVGSPKMAATLLRRVTMLAADRAAAPAVEELTTRECEIVGLIDEGLSNKQIAGRLDIELATVKNHVHRILEKLRVSRRGEVGSRLRLGARVAEWAGGERAMRTEELPG